MVTEQAGPMSLPERTCSGPVGQCQCVYLVEGQPQDEVLFMLGHGGHKSFHTLTACTRTHLVAVLCVFKLTCAHYTQVT